MPDVQEETEVQAVEKLLDDAIQKLQHGTVNFSDLVKLVAPPAVVTIPEKLPLPVQVTKAQSAALERLHKVFGVVQPFERRMLDVAEIDALIDEHGTLGTIAKMAEERRSSVRTAVLNHNDMVVEEGKTEEELASIDRDKDGHYVVGNKHAGEPGTDQQFSCEPKKGTVQMDPEALRALAADPEVEWFTHEDYLAMTEQVRRFSEEKAMLVLKKKPHLVRAIREATVTGAPSITLQLRNA